jgi:hypothetical protein
MQLSTALLNIPPATKSDLDFSKQPTMELLNQEFVSLSLQPNTATLSLTSPSQLMTSRWPIP